MDTQDQGQHDDPLFQAFRQEMMAKTEAKRAKAEEQSALKKQRRFYDQKQWRQQLKRLQQYLRLSSTHSATAGSMGAIFSDLKDLTMASQAIKAGLPNVGSLLQECELSILFISIDVEAFEFN